MDTYVAILCGLVVAAVLWKPFFGDWENFSECVRYWFTPDIVSLFNGEYGEDWWAEMKLGAWIVISVLFGISGYHALQ